MTRRLQKALTKKGHRQRMALEFDVAVGERIKAWRGAAGHRQEDLAAAIGVSGGTLSRYESGQMTCDPYTLALLAKTLRCTVSDFFDGIKVSG